MIGHSWALLRFRLDQWWQFGCWWSNVGSSKSSRLWAASVLHVWGGPTPWPEPTRPPPMHVSFLRTWCRLLRHGDARRVALWGGRNPSEKERERGGREQAMLIVLETTGRSPCTKCPLQRSFSLCFYYCCDWEKYWSNFCCLHFPVLPVTVF